MSEDPFVGYPNKVMLHHDNDGNTGGVTDAANNQWTNLGPVRPDWIPPGQILKCCHVIQLIKTQENPTCWYVIVGGRAYKVCSP
jgi:hypothetical protein